MRPWTDFDPCGTTYTTIQRSRRGLGYIYRYIQHVEFTLTKKLLEGILELQRVHNITHSREMKMARLWCMDIWQKYFLDTPMLCYPTGKVLQLTPRESLALCR